MTVLRHALRPGAYHDSIVLMQLRAALEEEPGVAEAGAVMASRENLTLLEASGLLPELPEGAGTSDLLVAVRAESADAAEAALERVDDLLRRDRGGTTSDYRPRSLSAAVRMLPAARWVLVSVPGRFATGVAREALDLGRHVFLFSDHVPLDEEVSLKRHAGARGLLVMGPDCGTAIVRGVGFGFANRIRRGPVGIVAASGTGLQAVACGVHVRGSGVSHAIGTGGRDLSAEVGGITALQGLELLAGDPETRVIVLVSKPPAPEVAERVLAAARGAGKPVVVRFVGAGPIDGADGPGGDGPSSGLGGARSADGVCFAHGLSHAADLAVWLATAGDAEPVGPEAAQPGLHEEGGARASVNAAGASVDAAGEAEAPATAPLPGHLRGLFAGGTLAQEALIAAARFLEPGSLHANLEAPGVALLADPWTSRRHTILDLGADVFTAGRPHPMLDQEVRIRRLREEAADPETAYVLLDVVLGDGAHPDPASELAPAIEAACRRGREVAVILVGTDRDPQDLEKQASRLAGAGARIFHDVESALRHARERLSSAAGRRSGVGPPTPDPGPGAAGRAAGSRGGRGETGRATVGDAKSLHVEREALRLPVAAINVGLEAFHRSLVDREVPAVHVEWRPPAGGDERLAAALRKLRG